MRSLRWAFCAVLVSPLALAAGRLTSKQDSVGEEPVASSTPHEVAIVLVPPHDPVPGGLGPLGRSRLVRGPLMPAPRAAQLALARPAAAHSGVRGSSTTVTSQLAVYRVGRAAVVTKTSSVPAAAPPASPPTRPKPPPAPPEPAPKPRPKPAPAPPPAGPAPPPAAPSPVPPSPPASPPAPPIAVAPAPPAAAVVDVAPAEPGAAPTDDGSKPGNGYGDRNHEHSGPPGQAKKK